MTTLQITLDLDIDPWVDLLEAKPQLGLLERIGLLRNGTTDGNASVAFVITLADGSHVIAQTTWKLLRSAVGAMTASPVIAEEMLDP